MAYMYNNNMDMITKIVFFPVLYDAGTHDIHALILGRAITGIQAFTST